LSRKTRFTPILLDNLFVLQYICFNTNAKALHEWCLAGVGLRWLGHLPKKLNVEEFDETA